MSNKIKFVANAVRWHDKANGNTYHSVNITRTSDGATIHCAMKYGYGEHYKQTALGAMYQSGWIDHSIYTDNPNYKHCDKANLFMYERENNYPIMWNVTDGLKRDCIANGNA